jgi:drug/metabolite transporter (DMT)-like permease
MVALATTTEPVIAALVTFVWMGEVPAPLVIAGSVVTLAGVVLGMIPSTPSPDEAR